MTEVVLMKAMDTIASICKKDFLPLETEEWIRRFSDVTDEEFLTAYNAYMDTMDNTFLPAPGSIKKHVMKARENRRLKYLPTVVEIESEIRGNLNSYSSQPTYSHPIIDDIVDRLGYSRLCAGLSEDNHRNITWAAKEALEHYIDSGEDYYTEEAERRLEARKAKEPARLGNGGMRQIGN